jgi:hypothetical protein
MNKTSADISRGRPWVAITVLILVFLTLVLGTSDLVRHADAVEEPRIEIAIRDFTYVRTKMQSIRAGTPLVFVVHNEDSVTHGFISPLFLGRSLQGGGEGIEAFGTGIEGFHIDPGKTLMIRLTPDQQGKVTFRCDLHPEVQGELYLLDVPVG